MPRPPLLVLALALGFFALAGEPARADANDANATSAGAAPARPGSRVSQALNELADWVKARGGTLSARVSEADSGAVWAEANPALALNPASNMKVLTAAVALDQLGAEYRFSTGLYGTIAAGRVDPLVLRGHGDPSLGSDDLCGLARALAHLGVSEVGMLFVDQSRFDDQFVPPAFEQQPEEWAGFRAPVSAVALERNVVTLVVLPTVAGQPARVWFEPPGIVTIDGSVATGRPGSGESIRLSMEARPDALIAHVGGQAAQGLPRLRFERRLDDPRRAPGLALAAILTELGIPVRGGVALGGADVKQRLVFHESAPLAELLPELGKNSENFYAEMILKALGAEASGPPARSQEGAKALSAWLTARGIGGPELRIENGSGLFDANRVSAKTMVGVLTQAYRNPAIYPEFLAQFAIGGADGTLRSRFRQLSPKRSIRAKTGTLAATIGLSGYALSDRGQAPIAFAFLINQIEGHTGEARQRIDKVVEAIARARSASD